MAREKRVRKPKPFVVEGRSVAWCEYNGVVRMVNLEIVTLLPSQVRRLSAWLARALAWIEDGKKGGG